MCPLKDINMSRFILTRSFNCQFDSCKQQISCGFFSEICDSNFAYCHPFIIGFHKLNQNENAKETFSNENAQVHSIPGHRWCSKLNP